LGRQFAFIENPAFEPFGPSRRLTLRPTTFFDRMGSQLLRLKPGLAVQKIEIGEFGIARNAKASCGEFRKFKNEGKFAAGTRLCVTFAGPGTKFGCIAMPPKYLYPLIEKSFKAEIARVLEVASHEELAIQLDLAGEVELEEYRRRPQDFQMPIFEASHEYWNMDEAVNLIANVASAVPTELEFGFHLCAIYHIDEGQDQALNVHFDWANALSERIKRPIGYIHIPTAPDHKEKDFETLKRLRLHPETKLFIGLIHLQDGIEGARRRIRGAAKSWPDFGIAAFCGSNQPSRREYLHPHSVDEIFEIHRMVAEINYHRSFSPNGAIRPRNCGDG